MTLTFHPPLRQNRKRSHVERWHDAVMEIVRQHGDITVQEIVLFMQVRHRVWLKPAAVVVILLDAQREAQQAGTSVRTPARTNGG